MSRMNDPVSQPTAEPAEKARSAVSDIGQNVREMGEQARQAAREQYEHLRDHAADYYERGRERAVEWEQDLEHYIQDRPIQSLLIAVGVGFVLGALWKRS